MEIRPQVSGKVTKVCVKEGAFVRRGQTLFVIDQVPYREALEKARATLATAKASEATVRFRPIVMTVLCMVVGMLPLVFADGVGVVGGLLLGTVALLFAPPHVLHRLPVDRRASEGQDESTQRIKPKSLDTKNS